MNIDIAEMMRQKGRLSEINSELETILKNVNSELDTVSNVLRSNSLTESNEQVKETVINLSGKLNTNLTSLEQFFASQLNDYTVTNEEAKNSLQNLVSTLSSSFSESGAFLGIAAVETAVSDDTQPMTRDVSVYTSKPERGFVVSTDNKTYQLSDSDFDLLCSIVAAESDKSYDDSLAVISTILNRCEDNTWVNYVKSSDPIKQATFPNQFVVYQNGSNTKYTNGRYPEEVRRAVEDALAGVRNHDYLSFRSNGSSSYSKNMITPTGNRYK